MPGVSLVCGLNGRPVDRTAALNAMSTGVHGLDYRREPLLTQGSLFIGCSRYEAYPLACYESDEFWICLEGRIYDGDAGGLSERLFALAPWLFAAEPGAEAAVREWLLATDGDFVVVAVSKLSGAVAILNDVLGRLPLYYHLRDGAFVLSREPSFVVRMAEVKAMDPMAIAQNLVFGHPLGERTLFAGISRLSPASLVRIEAGRTRVEMRVVHRFNFDLKEHRGRTLAENAAELARLFRAACQARASRDGANVVALSGGLDSRSVVGGLMQAGAAFSAATYRDPDNRAARDIKAAEEVARAVGTDWRCLSIPFPRGRDHIESLRAKLGLS